MKKFIKALKNKTFKRYIKQEQASALPFFAMTIPVMLGMVGLGTDASLWMSQKSNLQTAADSAVMAAGWEMAQDSEEYMDYAAYKEAVENGYKPDANGEVLLQTISQNSQDGFTIIGITLTQDAETFFSKIIFKNQVRISAYAEARVGSKDGDFCILALEQEDPNALTTFGTVGINSPECGIAVNSFDEEALTMSGNVSIDVSTVRISGDYDLGGSVDFNYDTLKTNQSALEDPYENLEMPEPGACDHRNARYNSTSTLTPGTYCGGINITGNNDITFAPGVYIIDGGDFDVAGSGSLYGDDVTFLLTGSGNDYAQLDISGSRSVEFSAPNNGSEWDGITFFQDRNAPIDARQDNKIVGTSDIIFNGVAYFPSQALRFGGNASLTGGVNPCTKLIARTVTMSGNPLLGNECDGYDLDEVQVPEVKLIN